MAKRRTSNENEDQDELEYEETLSKRARVDEQGEEREDAEEPMVFEDALPRKTAGVRSFTHVYIGHSSPQTVADCRAGHHSVIGDAPIYVPSSAFVYFRSANQFHCW